MDSISLSNTDAKVDSPKLRIASYSQPDLIFADGLVKTFDERSILNEVNLTVREGDSLALLGATGGGKSVLLRALLGLSPYYPVDKGEIYFKGKALRELDERGLQEFRRQVVYVPQQGGFLSGIDGSEPFTIRHNFVFFFEHKLGLSEQEADRRMYESLDAVGLPQDTASKFYSHLSGGMKRRASIALAHSLNPQVIVFDEPTAGLHERASSRITDLIHGLSVEMVEGVRRTMIVTTHDLQLARRMGKVALLHDGKLHNYPSYEAFDNDRGNGAVRHYFAPPVQEE